MKTFERFANSTIGQKLGVPRLLNKMATLKAVDMVKGKKLGWTPKTIFRTRLDIKSWSKSQDLRNDVETPRNYAIMIIFDEARLDALLTSQIENRKRRVLYADFVLKDQAGEVNEDATKLLKTSKAYKDIMDAILESHYMGYSLIELTYENKELTVTLIPRTNVTPQNGRFYPNFLDDKFISYRELPEYGKWILEFDTGEMGLLNKAIPHVLFKRFAQSCWSELCEIAGIPPRVMKTNTGDTNALNRAEQMMRDMGAAAWFIIDETEEFEFAENAVDNKGDVYNNLIKLCNDENSLLVNGAIIGQDTAHGNRSKEQASQNVLWELIKSDKENATMYWNHTVIPALVKIGVLPAGLTYELTPEEDTKQLFEFTKGLLQYKNVDNEWIEDKFGVPVTDKATTTTEDDPDKKVEDAIDKKLSAFFA